VGNRFVRARSRCSPSKEAVVFKGASTCCKACYQLENETPPEFTPVATSGLSFFLVVDSNDFVHVFHNWIQEGTLSPIIDDFVLVSTDVTIT